MARRRPPPRPRRPPWRPRDPPPLPRRRPSLERPLSSSWVSGREAAPARPLRTAFSFIALRTGRGGRGCIRHSSGPLWREWAAKAVRELVVDPDLYFHCSVLVLDGRINTRLQLWVQCILEEQYRAYVCSNTYYGTSYGAYKQCTIHFITRELLLKRTFPSSSLLAQ